MRRVAVTGMGGITPIGDRWEEIEARLRAGQSGVRRMAEWNAFPDLNTKLAAPCAHFTVPDHYPRRMVRSMGRVALLAIRATELALEQAGLLNDPILTSGNTGIAYGSSGGSVEPVRHFGHMLDTGSMQGITSTSYIQMMGHTCAVNLGLFFGIKGRIIPTSSACTSGSQGIGYAYESIKHGKQKIMLAGGAEELSAPAAAVFDTLFATSTKNDHPELTPRPFDKNRDGLVIGEGACTLILEDWEHAKARGATIYAEIVGFGTNSDGSHVTQPEADTMARAMQLALEDACLPASKIGYVSAHGTATDRGDIAESQATAQVLGKNVPVSAMKSYIGHTLGACGAIESWWGIEMMRRGWFAPTLNLTEADPACASLNHIDGAELTIQPEYFMNNNFAFGGINTSLVLRKAE